MQDIGPVLISVCGLLCVAGGLLAVIAFLVLKATGRTLLGAFDEIGGVAAALGVGEASGDVDTDIPSANRRGFRRDLRARAESLDFDSAVARQSNPLDASQAAPRQPFIQPTQPPGTPAYPAAPPAPISPTQPPQLSPFDEESLPGLRRRRTRRDRADDADDEPDMLAGIMGEDE